ncbi:hypothetical protein TNCV_3174141 [Trichonephila clavipes]|nr:hypothetical protein TNCV_3174141 [Trichonephila clavipes]
MSCVTCCTVLLEPQLVDIMIVQFRNEKVSNHGSIPITIDCNVVAFIVFEEGFHQPIKRTKRGLSEKESNGGELSCSNLDFDENIKLRASDCEESEKSAGEIDNIPINTGIYIARNGIEWILHIDNFSDRFET